MSAALTTDLLGYWLWLSFPFKYESNFSSKKTGQAPNAANVENINVMKDWFGFIEQVAYAFSKTSKMAPFRDLFEQKKTSKHQASFNSARRPLQTRWSLRSGLCHGKTNSHLHPLLLVFGGFCPPLEVMQLHGPDPPHCCTEGWTPIYICSRFYIGAESWYLAVEGSSCGCCWPLKRHITGCWVAQTSYFVLTTRPFLGLAKVGDQDTVGNPGCWIGGSCHQQDRIQPGSPLPGHASEEI